MYLSPLVAGHEEECQSAAQGDHVETSNVVGEGPWGSVGKGRAERGGEGLQKVAHHELYKNCRVKIHIQSATHQLLTIEAFPDHTCGVIVNRQYKNADPEGSIISPTSSLKAKTL